DRFDRVVQAAHASIDEDELARSRGIGLRREPAAFEVLAARLQLAYPERLSSLILRDHCYFQIHRACPQKALTRNWIRYRVSSSSWYFLPISSLQRVMPSSVFLRRIPRPKSG